MILIISKDAESTTDLVIDWLIKWKLSFIRINDELYNDIEVDFQNNLFKIKGIDINEFKVIWFRKYSSSIDEISRNYLNKKISKSFGVFYSNEASAFRQFFFNELRKIKK
ncbi:hypothetical protein [Elizabethkingia anophelis]|uniref:hypothetical protein n=1 Tax=Elizabethkingia anophelis TaxID=1117645 RepID=UPI003891563D